MIGFLYKLLWLVFLKGSKRDIIYWFLWFAIFLKCLLVIIICWCKYILFISLFNSIWLLMGLVYKKLKFDGLNNEIWIKWNF